ncbi:uncharacterized protein N7473_011334 [Penicillium subrubescens]|uniref:uncharacterized protein n=1 Tax=Penicillium subrubescens TaxID=1316194 RepID=UPI002544F74E|nr:uncharacterized protein N7473_011334 [Penicillium subrubescens]KAJ5880281.1 hypothetical protein N7473_011334 [Penicillium subrubescens]
MGTNPPHRCTIRWITLSVCCAALTVRARAREKDGDPVPDCMGTAPTRRGIMQPAPVGHLWEQDTRRSPFDLVGWGERNNRPGSAQAADIIPRARRWKWVVRGLARSGILHEAGDESLMGGLWTAWSADRVLRPCNGVYATVALCYAAIMQGWQTQTKSSLPELG